MMTEETTRQDVIEQAEGECVDIFLPPGPGRYERASDPELAQATHGLCEMGFADEESGDSYAPTGYFMRLDRWLVTVNEQGFVSLTECDTEREAAEMFQAAEREFSNWLDTQE